MMADGSGLTVAVTGPTGDIGRAAVRALEASPEVGRIVGMARRPFDGSRNGWKRTQYRRGDVLDRASVDELVAGADVVVHLAFLIFGSHDETREINLRGSRNVFEAAVAAGAKRLVYTSSVAAYGFHPANPDVLTEEIPTLGTRDFYYSAQKAELEALLEEITAGQDTDVYVFRPCIVAGRDAPTLIEGFTGQKVLGRRVRLAVARAGRAAAGGAGAARQRDSVPARAPRRRRERGSGGGPGAREPGHLQPRERRRDQGERRGARTRMARRAGATGRGRCAGRGGGARAAAARRGGLGGRAAQAGPDGHRKGAARASVARRGTMPAKRSRRLSRPPRWRGIV